MDTTLAQVNARIDASLKVSGDAALAEAGLTPTKAIRAMWGLFPAWRTNPIRSGSSCPASSQSRLPQRTPSGIASSRWREREVR